jgi:hypothetical protein
VNTTLKSYENDNKITVKAKISTYKKWKFYMSYKNYKEKPKIEIFLKRKG